MTLKEELDEIWNTGSCLCPNHLVRWNKTGIGWIRWASLGLYYTRGKRMGPRRLKVKSKGYSFLPKNYLLYHTWINTY